MRICYAYAFLYFIHVFSLYSFKYFDGRWQSILYLLMMWLKPCDERTRMKTPRTYPPMMYELNRKNRVELDLVTVFRVHRPAARNIDRLYLQNLDVFN